MPKKKRAVDKKALPEQTGNQVAKTRTDPFSVGISAGGSLGFRQIAKINYEYYRKISAHPVVALAKSIVISPIVRSSWNYVKKTKDVPDEIVQFIRDQLDQQRDHLVIDCLAALEYGFSPFEVVYTVKKGQVTLDRCKPLMWDNTFVLVDDGGKPEGLVNYTAGSDKPVELYGEKFFIFTNDAVCGNPYGRSRHENILKEFNESEQIRTRMAQYMKKNASPCVLLYYPVGTGKDEAGADRDNMFLAQGMLDAVSRGDSIRLPNGFTQLLRDDPQAAYELAGKSDWKLDTLEVGHTDHLPGMTKALTEWHELLFMGWLRPPRTGLEAQHGSRADATVHTDTSTYDCELIDREIARAVNLGLVDKLLELNFGEEAVGTVFIEPAPLQDDAADLYKAILRAMLADPNIAPSVAQKIDIDAVLDASGVPVDDDARGPFGSEIIPNQPNPQHVKPSNPNTPQVSTLPPLNGKSKEKVAKPRSQIKVKSKSKPKSS